MTIESILDINTRPVILETLPVSLRDDDAVILQDAGRTTPLKSGTIMAQISASLKWVPYTDITAVTGAGLPAGIYDPEGSLGDILAADLVAGDVVNMPILKFGAMYDKDRITLENSLTLETPIPDGIQTQTVEQALNKITLFSKETQSGSRPENA